MMKKILLISSFMLGTMSVFAQTGDISNKIGVWYKTDSKQSGASSLNGFLPLNLQKASLSSLSNLQNDKNNFYVVFNSADKESVDLINMQIRCFSFGLETRPEKMNIPNGDLLNRKIKTGAIFKYEFQTSIDLQDPTANFFLINDSKEDHTNIYEVLYFKGGLVEADHKQIQTYLALKYGITLLNLANYVDVFGKTIWNENLNNLANQEIIGLGNHAGFGFSQSETSNSMSDFLNFRLSDSSAELKPNDFIYVGATQAKEATIQFDKTSEKESFLNKQWLVQINHSNQYKTDLIFNTNQIAGFDAKDTYYLQIDRLGSRFDANGTVDRIKGKIVNQKLVFEKVQWDIDGNGYDSFTISKKMPHKSELKVDLVDRWYIEEQQSIEIVPIVENPADESIKATWYFEGKLVGNQLNLNTAKEGIYQLRITAENEEQFIYETQVMELKNVGVSNYEWNIYPNPVAINEFFTIDFGFKEPKNVEVYIYQQNGKIVSRHSLGTIDQQSIDTQLNTAGVYFIVAIINGKSEIKKIAVK